MSKSKAQTLTLCGTLALDLDDSTAISRFFDDVVEDLAQAEIPLFVSAALVNLTSGTGTYSFTSAMLRLFHVIMEDSQIFETSEDGLDGYSSTWRTDTGTPLAFTQDFLSRQYTLWPEPDFTTGALGGGGENFGEDYPDDPLFVFYADDRATAIQEYYALPLALFILAREFSFASKHEDEEFSKACLQLAEFMLQMMEGK